MGGAFPHLQCHESIQCAHVGVDINGKVFLFLFKNNLLLCYKIKIFIYICIANLSYAAQSACALKVNNHRLRPVRQRSHSGKKMAQRPTFWSKSNKLLRTMDAPYHELLLAAAGSELGFNSLIQRFSSMLYSHAYGILGNKEMAEEVVSDVFFETWKRRKQLVELNNVRSWLCRVVHRKAIDYLRREKRRGNTISVDYFGMQDFLFPEMCTPCDTLISREDLTLLNAAIERLPPKCRYVFFLAKVGHMPYIEIAELLDITVSTVNYHVNFAIKTLRSTLMRTQHFALAR